MDAIAKFFNLLSSLILLLFSILIGLSFVSNTNVLGGLKFYVVQSGSMSPTINIGDIIVVNPQHRYFQNDVITFKTDSNSIVTHRIVEVKDDNKEFVTKGDANRSIDQGTVMAKSVIGKVIYVIPKLGYLSAFAKTPLGILVFIGVPIFALVFDKLAKKN
ncbi:MAG: S26 family signal peptidase [Patescibacteria group bacterium]|nr:MAG: S26 family signal peptidase [Patescibacteria group bacterium]GIW63203.1 MAG: S26 family signal peptidase [Patescibacteria group bacterium]